MASSEKDVAACELTEFITVDENTDVESIAAFYTVSGGLLTDVKVYREGSADLDDPQDPPRGAATPEEID